MTPNLSPKPFAFAAGRTPEFIEMKQIGPSRKSGSAQFMGR